MKNSKNKSKFKWGIWVPAIAAVIAGCFLLINTLLSNSQTTKPKEIQSVKDQKVDSGTINNFNAKGNINVYNRYNTDTMVPPPAKLESKEKKLKSSSIKQKPTISAGNNNTIIVGDNNTVNKYGLEINNPKIEDIKEETAPGKFILPDPLNKKITPDSLFKSIVTFKYLYQLRGRKMLIGVNNASQIKYIDFQYTDYGMYSISKENIRKVNGDQGILISDPINGGMKIEIYSAVKYSNIKDKLAIFVDSFALK